MTRRPARPAGLRVTVVVQGRAIAASRGLGSWLVRAAPPRASGAVVLALVSDRAMRTLNRRFRGVDKPTDVLSFQEVADRVVRSDVRQTLGEIAIASGVARRQALAFGHSLTLELRILALHGLLHLLGYDHERDKGDMRRVEERLRRRARLPAGLIRRAPDATPP